MATINTANGKITPDQLGPTMMHEHLTVGLPGWEADNHPAPDYREMLAICIDQVAELQSFGIKSFVDPCPGDLGRDARLAADVSARTGMQIVVATGLFSDAIGSTPYWRRKFGICQSLGQDPAPYVTEMFVKEIEDGIGDTGVRAGVIKVATERGVITDYEKVIFRAAAAASLATGVPITTHTHQGELGLEQQALLTDAGVPPHRIIIGHSDGSPEHAYHMEVIRKGSYVGFDRWGYQTGMFGRPDDEKIWSLGQIEKAGGGRHVVVSCDHCCCWRGATWPTGRPMMDEESNNILHFVRVVAPRLLKEGFDQAALDRMMVENPRRYFCDTPVEPGAV